MMKIGLASGSAIKVQALTDALDEVGMRDWELFPIPKAKSGVNPQPMGHAMILRGAVNRVLSAEEINPDCDFYISMENGLIRRGGSIEDQFPEYAIVLAYYPSEHCMSWRKTAEVIFPHTVVVETMNRTDGFERWTVGQVMAEKGLVKNHADPHFDLVGIHRKDLLKEALVRLLKQEV